MNTPAAALPQLKSGALRLARPSPWTLVALVTAAIIATPILTVLLSLFAPSTDSLSHLIDTVLADYVTNSLLLMLGVSLGAGSIGVTCAWLTSMYHFPGRRLFSWALLLPLAMPAYIIAYTYTGLFEVAGPVQGWIRATFNVAYGEYWFPNVRSLGGAVMMFSLVLYPYVYLLARSAFLDQSVCALEASRTLGCGPWRSFFHVALPLARPAIVTGLSLALMETLADYGTVQFFGVSTFTTGIFRTWFGLYDATAAAQLAAMLLTFVFVLVMLERWSRRQQRYHNTGQRYQALPEIRLRPATARIATLACFLPLFFGFLLPAGQLGLWAVDTWREMVDAEFVDLALHSFALAGGAALIALIPAILLAYGLRVHATPAVRLLTRLSGMGYAIPGTVIAVGVMIPFGKLDNAVDAWSRETFDFSTGLLLSGTVFILIFAYVVRFLTVSLNTVEAGLGRIKPSMDEAARSMGYGSLEVVRRVHLPVMRGSLLTAVIIVFVDVLKELPATLVLRPFNFNTLAVRAWELAADERLADSSTAALAIVLVGIVPVILLSLTIARSRPGHAR